jgi:hypothetical protein
MEEKFYAASGDKNIAKVQNILFFVTIVVIDALVGSGSQ